MRDLMKSCTSISLLCLIGVAEEHSELVKKFRQQDKTYLGEIIRGHISGEKPFASLTSRSVDYTII